jgi:ribonuclease P protein component
VNSGRVVGEGFSRDDRLRKRREFEECYASGVRVSGRFLQLFVNWKGAQGSARLGISIPRRAGKAVVRNRLRRRIREIFRRNRALFGGAGLDLVIQCRPQAASASFPQLLEDYSGSVARARTRRARP